MTPGENRRVVRRPMYRLCLGELRIEREDSVQKAPEDEWDESRYKSPRRIDGGIKFFLKILFELGNCSLSTLNT